MINLKLRLQNKVTLTAIIGAVFLIAQQLGLEVPQEFKDVVNVLVSILVVLGIVNDPTTSGLSDSSRALEYTKPSEE